MSRYIDADELINDLDGLCEIVCQYSKKQRAVMCGACPLGDAFDHVDNMPAADVQEVRHGRWITEDKGHYFYDWKCSVCGGSGRSDYLFCPICGAKMVNEDE